jgi:hypothetical protein
VVAGGDGAGDSGLEGGAGGYGISGLGVGLGVSAITGTVGGFEMLGGS